jgi:RHS repeat-associated protein
MSVVYDSNNTDTNPGITYYYVTNIQGDVIAILDSNRVVKATYNYDAWGNSFTTNDTINSTIGNLNPLRYRGYVYDTESGLYYLQSRYYDPEIGRFLNADILISTGQGLLGNNMFAYCTNNPVNFWDPAGTCKNAFSIYFKVDCGQVTCPSSASFPKKNYSNNESPNFSHTKTIIHKNISKEEANHLYDTIKKGDFGEQPSIDIVGQVLGFFDDPKGKALSIAHELSNSLTTFGNSDTYDPEGRLLYLEEGYDVIIFDRGFFVGRNFRTEKEYFIYDSNGVLQYNDVLWENSFNKD